MISIAICDDDKKVCIDCEQYIDESHIPSLSLSEIETFSSGGDLVKKLEGGKYYDLIFMDIEMDNGDGIAAGQLLREKYCHASTLLIYISGHTKYHGRLFDVQPYQFIQKPIKPEEFIRKLKLAVTKIENGNEIYRYKKGRDFFQIRKKDVIFLESKGHNVIVHADNAEPVVFRGVLREEFKKLANAFFVQTHIAYLINIDHVKSFHGTHMIMDNEIIVPISEHRAKEVKQAFLCNCVK